MGLLTIVRQVSTIFTDALLEVIALKAVRDTPAGSKWMPSQTKVPLTTGALVQLSE